MVLTSEAVGDGVSVGVEGLHHRDGGAGMSVLAHQHRHHRLGEDGRLVVDVPHGDADVGGGASRRSPVVGRRHREVVRVVRGPLVVQPPATRVIVIKWSRLAYVLLLPAVNI